MVDLKNRMLYFVYFAVIIIFFSFSFITPQKSKELCKIDVLHYRFQLDLSDHHDTIVGQAQITTVCMTGGDGLVIDLKSVSENGKGMAVAAVTRNGEELSFEHQDDSLWIFSAFEQDERFSFLVEYRGIPDDGLIISKNMFGDRTFFGDNWPNRAHNWLPCVDHPSDKATVEFVVHAPSHYQVISNGVNIETVNYPDHTLWHYSSTVPLPTKVMVIGVARFAKQDFAVYNNVPISNWVYPQNKEIGFDDYSVTLGPLEYFEKKIAPYPYAKLANVQSKTIFGGMENAGCIFYYERSVNGKRNHEALFAHEIVHQWFGNSVTEKHWDHLWLSEGFATYLTDLYVRDVYGKERFYRRLKWERKQVLKFAKRRYTPVIDSLNSDYRSLLNNNSYEKGGWFLHMLREKVGEEVFWEGIRNFYNNHKFQNASTADFRSEIEKSSNVDLKFFFDQWLRTPGHPLLDVSHRVSQGNLTITIEQLQDKKFSFPLEIMLKFRNGKEQLKKVAINKKNEQFSFEIEDEFDKCVLDPNIKLLYEFWNEGSK